MTGNCKNQFIEVFKDLAKISKKGKICGKLFQVAALTWVAIKDQVGFQLPNFKCNRTCRLRSIKMRMGTLAQYNMWIVMVRCDKICSKPKMPNSL